MRALAPHIRVVCVCGIDHLLHAGVMKEGGGCRLSAWSVQWCRGPVGMPTYKLQTQGYAIHAYPPYPCALPSPPSEEKRHLSSPVEGALGLLEGHHRHSCAPPGAAPAVTGPGACLLQQQAPNAGAVLGGKDGSVHPSCTANQANLKRAEKSATHTPHGYHSVQEAS